MSSSRLQPRGTLLFVTAIFAFTSCGGGGRSPSTKVGPAPSPVNAVASLGLCPRAVPLPFDPEAHANATSTVKKAVALLFRSVNTAGFRIVTAVPATSRDAGSFGELVGGSCGHVARQRTYVVRLEFPAMLPSAALSQARLFVSRFASGWQVWGSYPPGLQTTTTGSSSPPTASTATVPQRTTLDSIPPASARGPVYLALGDSAPIWNGNDSYPNHIVAHYAAGIPGLELVNLAESGATTTSMLHGSMGTAGSQLQQATKFLRAHRASIALITIDIGGNDVLGCFNIGTTSADSAVSSCLQRAEATMVTNLDAILAGLRQAAGPSARIVGMTYYDPFLGNWLAGGAAQAAAVESVSRLVHLNSLLANTYARAAARVADVQGAFQSTDLSTRVASRWGRIPIAVARACTLLAITCQAGRTEGFGDDPNPAGAEVIANAFENAIGSIEAPG